MQELRAELKKICRQLFDIDIEPQLTRPDEQFGDFSTNVALQLAPKVGKNPREIAEALASYLQDSPDVAEVSVAGPGFINIKLTDEAMATAAWQADQLDQPLKNQEIQTYPSGRRMGRCLRKAAQTVRV